MNDRLDNPAWHALTTDHERYAIGDDRARRYEADISPIAALRDGSPASLAALARIAAPGEVIAVLNLPVDDAPGFATLMTVEVSQWVCERAVPPAGGEFDPLGADDAEEMYALAKATDPGPFERRTYCLGDYVGIRRDGALAAMAGERLCFEGAREVSGVCTAPAFTGQGFARRLVAEITRRQQAAGSLPFLHVRVGSPAEAAASHVYAGLGFTPRRTYPMLVLRRH